jgi:apolipoprotein N-acyltransferase
MKVLENSANRLVLRVRPWKLAALIGSFVLVFAAVVIAKAIARDVEEAGRAALPMALLALAFIVFVRETVLTLDRPAGEVTIAIRSVFGRRATLMDLADIRQATAEADPQGEHDSKRRPLQRPVLVLQDGRVVPILGSYSSGGDTDALLVVLKPWLNPGKTRPR